MHDFGVFIRFNFRQQRIKAGASSIGLRIGLASSPFCESLILAAGTEPLGKRLSLRREPAAFAFDSLPQLSSNDGFYRRKLLILCL
jgi:hypothetical protein